MRPGVQLGEQLEPAPETKKKSEFPETNLRLGLITVRLVKF